MSSSAFFCFSHSVSVLRVKLFMLASRISYTLSTKLVLEEEDGQALNKR